MILRYVWIALWCIGYPLSLMGFSRASRGLCATLEEGPALKELFLRLCFGLASTGLCASLFLVFGMFNPWIFFGLHLLAILLAWPVAKHLGPRLLRGWTELGRSERALSCLIFTLLVANLVKMLAPTGGPESSRYHFFFPLLFAQEGSLWTDRSELLTQLINFWGMEVSLALPEALGQQILVQVTLWLYYVLLSVAVQVLAVELKLSPFYAMVAVLLTLLAPVYPNLLWWTKTLPLHMALTTAILLCLLGGVARRQGEGERWGGTLTLACLIAYTFSIKITFVLFVPFFVFFLFNQGYSLKRVLTLIGASAFFFMPWMVFAMEKFSRHGKECADSDRSQRILFHALDGFCNGEVLSSWFPFRPRDARGGELEG